jgi:hypothetical protein
MKLRTFEIAFSKKGSGLGGYENPTQAQVTKMINTVPREYIENLVIETRYPGYQI